MLLLVAGSASAATFYTPLLLATTGGNVACNVTNVSNKGIEVSVDQFNGAGTNVTVPALDFCPIPPATLGPLETCAVLGPPNTGVLCRVVRSSAKIRAIAVAVSSGGETIAVMPATK